MEDNKNVQKILRIVIFVSAMIFLLTTFIIVNESDALNYNEAKQNLEKAVDKSYDFQNNTVDISQLKDNINNNVDKSKIINPDTVDFPVVTAVDKYKFKVQEDGNVEDANKEKIENINDNSENNMENKNIVNEISGNVENNTNIENILTNNTIENTVETNTIANNIDDGIVKETTLLYMLNDNKEYKGVSATTNEDGIVTLNGKSASNIFIKISNGIDMQTNGNINTSLAKQEPILMAIGKNIKINIKEISGEVITANSAQQCNVVMKYEDGVIATNCKLKENMFYQELTLQKNISMIYIFVSQNVELNNYKIKPEINIIE